MSTYTYQVPTNERKDSLKDVVGPLMPARMFFFVVVDEPGKDGLLVRRTYATANAPYLEDLNLGSLDNARQAFPERHGLWPKGPPDSPATIAEHVLQLEQLTSYASTSANYPGGATRFTGKTVYVDIAAAKRSGAKLVTTPEILQAIDQYIKSGINADKRRWAEHIKRKVEIFDSEILVQPKPSVPATGVFSQRGLRISLGLTKYARVVQVFGLAFSAYDVAVAVDDSIRLKSVRPIEKEAIRQIGGWGGGAAGSWASAAAAARVGAATGSVVGIELGPGAVLTGMIGGILFGAIGYFAGSAIAEHIPDR
ncbi:glycine zipper family protein [Paraburkholderia azotifigens]|uniref:glycine zipper family protein n=1 Tax=Paraburkholderia azotifigens TaxID=2057004 RepID=UPI00317D7307